MSNLSNIRSPLILVISFTVCYIVAAAAYAMQAGNTEFVFYIVVMFVIGGAIAYVHRRVALSNGVLWCLSVWGLLHMAGGLVPVPESWPIDGEQRVLYSLWLIPNYLKYDQLVHVYGFGVTTWVCWQALSSYLEAITSEPICPTLGTSVLCVAGGMGFGALNEVIEFIATLTMSETNVGGYTNTGWDLVANLVGSVVAALAIWIHSSSRRTPC